MTTNAIELGQKIVNRNPATGEVVSEHSISTVAEIHSSVERARAAQPAWNALGVARRVQILRKFQELLLRDRDALARKITQEAGKPLVESLLSEVFIRIARYADI